MKGLAGETSLTLRCMLKEPTKVAIPIHLGLAGETTYYDMHGDRLLAG